VGWGGVGVGGMARHRMLRAGAAVAARRRGRSCFAFRAAWQLQDAARVGAYSSSAYISWPAIPAPVRHSRVHSAYRGCLSCPKCCKCVSLQPAAAACPRNRTLTIHRSVVIKELIDTHYKRPIPGEIEVVDLTAEGSGAEDGSGADAARPRPSKRQRTAAHGGASAAAGAPEQQQDHALWLTMVPTLEAPWSSGCMGARIDEVLPGELLVTRAACTCTCGCAPRLGGGRMGEWRRPGCVVSRCSL
jgi:hypothetical protein